MPDALTVGGIFDGEGLLAYGLHLAGLEHRWLCEVKPERRTVLARRWPQARIYDDVRAVGSANAVRVDVIAGGFPCKGVSTVGKRNGFDHAETVLWREMARAIGELRPRYVLVENVANLLAIHGGALWGEVLGDLASFGFDVAWDCIPAAAFGAPHLRDRVIAIATHTASEDERPLEPARFRSDWGTGARRSGELAAAAGQAPADAAGLGRREAESGVRTWEPDLARGVPVEWGPYAPAIRRWEAVHGVAPEPLVRRVDDGRAVGVERSRLSALGDGVHVYLGHLAGQHIVELERRRREGATA